MAESFELSREDNGATGLLTLVLTVAVTEDFSIFFCFSSP
jgi:hypothetical protein